MISRFHDETRIYLILEFAPGEELRLADSMMKGDAAVPAGESAKVVAGGGGVVKLSLADTMDDF